MENVDENSSADVKLRNTETLSKKSIDIENKNNSNLEAKETSSEMNLRTNIKVEKGIEIFDAERKVVDDKVKSTSLQCLKSTTGNDDIACHQDTAIEVGQSENLSNESNSKTCPSFQAIWPGIPTPCPVTGCTKKGKFKKLNTFNLHWNKIHIEFSLFFECDYCNTKFESEKKVDVHKKLKSHKDKDFSIKQIKIANKNYIDPRGVLPYLSSSHAKDTSTIDQSESEATKESIDIKTMSGDQASPLVITADQNKRIIQCSVDAKGPVSSPVQYSNDEHLITKETESDSVQEMEIDCIKDIEETQSGNVDSTEQSSFFTPENVYVNKETQPSDAMERKPLLEGTRVEASGQEKTVNKERSLDEKASCLSNSTASNMSGISEVEVVAEKNLTDVVDLDRPKAITPKTEGTVLIDIKGSGFQESCKMGIQKGQNVDKNMLKLIQPEKKDEIKAERSGPVWPKEDVPCPVPACAKLGNIPSFSVFKTHWWLFHSRKSEKGYIDPDDHLPYRSSEELKSDDKKHDPKAMDEERPPETNKIEVSYPVKQMTENRKCYSKKQSMKKVTCVMKTKGENKTNEDINSTNVCHIPDQQHKVCEKARDKKNAAKILVWPNKPAPCPVPVCAHLGLFQTFEKFDEHFKSIHSSQIMYQCKPCNVTFHTKKDAWSHCRLTHKIKVKKVIFGKNRFFVLHLNTKYINPKGTYPYHKGSVMDNLKSEPSSVSETVKPPKCLKRTRTNTSSLEEPVAAKKKKREMYNQNNQDESKVEKTMDEKNKPKAEPSAPIWPNEHAFCTVPACAKLGTFPSYSVFKTHWWLFHTRKSKKGFIDPKGYLPYMCADTKQEDFKDEALQRGGIESSLTFQEPNKANESGEDEVTVIEKMTSQLDTQKSGGSQLNEDAEIIGSKGMPITCPDPAHVHYGKFTELSKFQADWKSFHIYEKQIISCRVCKRRIPDYNLKKHTHGGRFRIENFSVKKKVQRKTKGYIPALNTKHHQNDKLHIEETCSKVIEIPSCKAMKVCTSYQASAAKETYQNNIDQEIEIISVSSESKNANLNCKSSEGILWPGIPAPCLVTTCFQKGSVFSDFLYFIDHWKSHHLEKRLTCICTICGLEFTDALLDDSMEVLNYEDWIKHISFNPHYTDPQGVKPYQVPGEKMYHLAQYHSHEFDTGTDSDTSDTYMIQNGTGFSIKSDNEVSEKHKSETKKNIDLDSSEHGPPENVSKSNKELKELDAGSHKKINHQELENSKTKSNTEMKGGSVENMTTSNKEMKSTDAGTDKSINEKSNFPRVEMQQNSLEDAFASTLKISNVESNIDQNTKDSVKLAAVEEIDTGSLQKEENSVKSMPTNTDAKEMAKEEENDSGESDWPVWPGVPTPCPVAACAGIGTFGSFDKFMIHWKKFHWDKRQYSACKFCKGRINSTNRREHTHEGMFKIKDILVKETEPNKLFIDPGVYRCFRKRKRGKDKPKTDQPDKNKIDEDESMPKKLKASGSVSNDHIQKYEQTAENLSLDNKSSLVVSSESKNVNLNCKSSEGPLWPGVPAPCLVTACFQKGSVFSDFHYFIDHWKSYHMEKRLTCTCTTCGFEFTDALLDDSMEVLNYEDWIKHISFNPHYTDPQGVKPYQEPGEKMFHSAQCHSHEFDTDTESDTDMIQNGTGFSIKSDNEVPEKHKSGTKKDVDLDSSEHVPPENVTKSNKDLKETDASSQKINDQEMKNSKTKSNTEMKGGPAENMTKSNKDMKSTDAGTDKTINDHALKSSKSSIEELKGSSADPILIEEDPKPTWTPWPNTPSKCPVDRCGDRGVFRKYSDFKEHWYEVHHKKIMCYRCESHKCKLLFLSRVNIMRHKSIMHPHQGEINKIDSFQVLNPVYICPDEAVPYLHGSPIERKQFLEDYEKSKTDNMLVASDQTTDSISDKKEEKQKRAKYSPAPVGIKTVQLWNVVWDSRVYTFHEPFSGPCESIDSTADEEAGPFKIKTVTGISKVKNERTVVMNYCSTNTFSSENTESSSDKQSRSLWPLDPAECPVPECQKHGSFVSFVKFRAHWSKAHTETKCFYQCVPCGIIFSDAEHTSAHRNTKTHDGEAFMTNQIIVPNLEYLDPKGVLPYQYGTATEREKMIKEKQKMDKAQDLLSSIRAKLEAIKSKSSDKS